MGFALEGRKEWEMKKNTRLKWEWQDLEERKIIFLLRRKTHLQKWVRVCRDEIIIFFLLLLLLQQLWQGLGFRGSAFCLCWKKENTTISEQLQEQDCSSDGLLLSSSSASSRF